MPLSDIVRALNAPATGKRPDFLYRSGLDHPFVAAEGRVFIHYANIRLESKFLPVVETRSGRTHGHASTIQAFGLSNSVPMSPDAVFVLPTDAEEFVYLDRLVRTLHALNYLTQPVRGNLLLRVHSRHIISVPANHGLAFEEILRPCGLLPEQITLEINTDAVADKEHFCRAVASYRSRGYGIAISHFGRTELDFPFLARLRPDIVKLDNLLLASGRPLDRIIDNIHELGGRILIEGIDSANLRRNASSLAIDLVQAHAPILRPSGIRIRRNTDGGEQLDAAA